MEKEIKAEDILYKIENGERRKIKPEEWDGIAFKPLIDAFNALRKLPKPKGSVYLIENSNGIVKIGRSSNAKARVRSIQTLGNVNTKNIFISSPHEDYHKTETSMHRQFFSKRLKGEWFEENFDILKSALERIIFTSSKNDSD